MPQDELREISLDGSLEMTPQTSFMIAAPLAKGCICNVRALLKQMTTEPGQADPANPLVPFGQFPGLHSARFLILEDRTTDDVKRIYGVAPPSTVYLSFLGEIDGERDAFLRELVEKAGPGLEEIFRHCDGFTKDKGLRGWIADHSMSPVAFYCNTAGRTVQQCLEEAELAKNLRTLIRSNPSLMNAEPRDVHRALRNLVQPAQTLSPKAKTPFPWVIRHMSDIGLLACLLLLSPIVFALFRFAIGPGLRRLENHEKPFTPRVDDWTIRLAEIEDWQPSNQYSAMGSVKPIALWRILIRATLFAIDLACRVIYSKGRLARINTIHFARWVYLDQGRRVLFCSSYDGSQEAYMDDFINKAWFGLNLAFAAGIGYPRTRWLIARGAADEQPFKHYNRRHQLRTEVWYKAYPETTQDLARNSMIRAGLEREDMSDKELSEWIARL